MELEIVILLLNKGSLSIVIKFALLFYLLIITASSLALEANKKAHISVQILGSGGPELTANRASSSYLVWLNNKAIILIDTGGGSSFRYGQSGAKWQDLQAVLFTHFHADHSSDFPAFIKASWFGDRTKDLDVFGPYGNSFMPSTKAFLDSLFGIKNGAFQYLSDMYDDKQSNEYKLIPHVLKDTKKLQNLIATDDFTIQAIQVQHGPIPAFAYVITLCGKTVVFSGDTNGKGFENLDLAKTDLFIAHNAIPENAGEIAQSLHMRPSQIGKIAKNIGTDKLILSHRMNRTLGNEQQTIKEIRKNYNSTLFFANDLAVFTVQ